MSDFVVPLLFVVVGLCLHAGLSHAFLALQQRSCLHLLFGLSWLAALVYSLYSIRLYESTTVADFVGAVRGQVVVSNLWNGIFVWLVALCSGNRPLGFLVGHNAVCLFVILLNASLPYPMVFSEVHDVGHGVSVVVSPLAMATYLPFALSLGFASISCYHLIQKGKHQSVWLLLLATAIQFLAAIIYVLISVGFIMLIGTAAFAFLGFILVMTLYLGLQQGATARSMQQQLAELELLYRTAPVGLSFLDTDARFVRINEDLANIHELPVEEHFGRTLREVLPSIADTIEPIYRRVLETGVPELKFIVEKPSEVSPSDVSSYMASYYPVTDPDGTILGVSAVVQDVTEPRRAEATIRESMDRLQGILDTAADAIVTIDQQGTISSANHAAEQMFGYSVDELLGQNVSMLMPLPYCNEPSSYLSRYLEIRQANRSEPGREVKGRRKDGSTFPIDFAVSEAKHLCLSTFVIRDNTDRKQAEESLHKAHEFSESLVRTARNIVLVLDLEGRIVQFNPYFEELTNWRLKEVKGCSWFELFLPERERRRIRALFHRAIATDKTRGNINPILTKDGSEREIEWYDTPLTNSDGKVIGLLATGQDVTETATAKGTPGNRCSGTTTHWPRTA